MHGIARSSASLTALFACSSHLLETHGFSVRQNTQDKQIGAASEKRKQGVQDPSKDRPWEGTRSKGFQQGPSK